MMKNVKLFELMYSDIIEMRPALIAIAKLRLPMRTHGKALLLTTRNISRVVREYQTMRNDVLGKWAKRDEGGNLLSNETGGLVLSNPSACSEELSLLDMVKVPLEIYQMPVSATEKNHQPLLDAKYYWGGRYLFSDLNDLWEDELKDAA